MTITSIIVKSEIDQLADKCNRYNLKDNNQFEILIQDLTNILTEQEYTTRNITNKGGALWLIKQSYLEEVGLNSPFITGLIASYRTVTQDDRNLSQKNVKQDCKNINYEFIVVNKYLSFDYLSQSIRVSFNQRDQAVTWGNYLSQELYICDKFSVEESLKENWKYELVIAEIKESEAQIIGEMINFGLPPGLYNPKEPE